jgi:tRNA A37 threonylcarbamoyladenosine modification protein TsaB
MAILGINCATENLALALLSSDNSCLEKNWHSQTIKTEQLLNFLDELLKAARQPLQAIEKIGIAIGPGALPDYGFP